MIVEFALYIVEVIIGGILAFTENILPTMPNAITVLIDEIFDIMFQGVNLIAVFVDIDFVILLIPIAIAITEFEHILALIMWVLKKIPFLSLK